MARKVYKPGVFSIGVMVMGLGVIVGLKVWKRGWGVSGWMDVVFYLLAPVGAGLVVNLFFARIEIDDEAIEIVGLGSRKKYVIEEIEEVKTVKGADVKFKLREGKWVTLPLWVGADGWGVAAAVRERMKRRSVEAKRA